MDREEAIEIIRKNMPSDKSLPVYDALQTLIPELAESEDDRMVVKIALTLSFAAAHNLITDYDELLAMQNWLEKQKGLDKMIVVSPEVWDKAIADAYENGKKDGEKQKEQKPAEHSAKGRRGRMGGIPEYVRRKAEAFRNKMEPPYDADDICSAYETGAMENANPSWCEEDEKIYNKALDVIYYKDLNDKDEVVDSLKALCDLIARKRRVIPPYARWKPSEEQMEALNALNLHGDLSYVGQQNQLISLYQDLKNLM